MDQSINFKKEPLGDGVFINVSRHHTFGTDAVLLSNFANAKAKDKLVDLGTGCGIIAFLMLRDKKCQTAYGVDISSEAIDLASLSAQENNFDNFTAICSDLKDLKDKVPFGGHTLVTCNPPYKAAGAGITNPDSVDRTARHETECTLKDIIAVSARLLQTGGRLCMCQRPERLSELMCTMSRYKIEPKRLRLVCKRPNTAPWLVLVEGRRCGNTGLTIEPNLYVEDENGNFSPEMVKIYGKYKEAYL
ncbi:MAG: methyltransferase [Clostridia bacterium]|nr:methyltransferase [Clostridia bacterium]